ncbi:MAG: UDP-N-acetylglucosamine--N-acetylmuramyl-(pentapeptide) pyrophosphoryl-undecaprenol N-acetylglucosamine transferase, partial [Acidimicrobiales bacterium]
GGGRAPTYAVVTGGGTGGHVQPALAVAEALVARGHEPRSIHFVGARRGMEAQLIPAAGFELTCLPGRGIRRRLALGNIAALGGLALAAARSVVLLGRRRPEVVVSLGGYAGLPASLAALIWRIPLVVVTIDAVPGAANRLVGRLATVNAVALEGTGLPRSELTGPPLRQAISALQGGAAGRLAARDALGLPPERSVLLVTGGSLGARRINEATVSLALTWARRGDLSLYHVTGARDLGETGAVAAAAGLGPADGGPGLDYHLVGYEPNMAAALLACDLAVARAGASTVAELAALGVPSILVPLPGAPRDHQTRNAAALEDVGAAVVLADADCDAERLGALAGELLSSPQRRSTMEAAARSLGRSDAAGRVAELAESVARRGRPWWGGARAGTRRHEARARGTGRR